MYVKEKWTIAEVARKNGVSYDEVYASMQSAIQESYKNANWLQKLRWNRTWGTGHVPSPEEFISRASDVL